jgi:hypothetical protein
MEGKQMGLFGVDPALYAELEQTYSHKEIEDLFANRGGSKEIRVRYRRPNGDLTTFLPSTRHMSYAWEPRNWVAVEQEKPAPVDAEIEVDIPHQIAQFARADKRGIFAKGDRSATFSLRQYEARIRAGWQFVELEDEDRARAINEARASVDDFPPQPAVQVSGFNKTTRRS